MKLTTTQRAYLAGYFDGEGTFSITKRPEKRSPIGFSYQPYCSVASVNSEVIEFLQQLVGKGFRVYRPRDGNANDAYEWQLTGIESIIDFINQLIPYLVLKKKVALKLKEFCLSRNGKMKLPRNKRGFTKKELRIFNEIRFLNKRGREQ